MKVAVRPETENEVNVFYSRGGDSELAASGRPQPAWPPDEVAAAAARRLVLRQHSDGHRYIGVSDSGAAGARRRTHGLAAVLSSAAVPPAGAGCCWQRAWHHRGSIRSSRRPNHATCADLARRRGKCSQPKYGRSVHLKHRRPQLELRRRRASAEEDVSPLPSVGGRRTSAGIHRRHAGRH